MFVSKPAVETTCGMEFAVIDALPKRVADQLAAAFPSVGAAGVRVVPTCMQAACDLSKACDEAEAEREALADKFTRWAVAVCGRLSSQGFWCDYVNPLTHAPVMHNSGDAKFPDTEAAALLLGYKAPIANKEFLILHPKWGGRAFAGTLVARAPADAIRAAVAGVEAELA